MGIGKPGERSFGESRRLCNREDCSGGGRTLDPFRIQGGQITILGIQESRKEARRGVLGWSIGRLQGRSSLLVPKCIVSLVRGYSRLSTRMRSVRSSVVSGSSRQDKLSQVLVTPRPPNQLPLLASFLVSWIPNIVLWPPWILRGSRGRIRGPQTIHATMPRRVGCGDRGSSGPLRRPSSPAAAGS